jgi:hypothetical protein
MVIVWEKWKTTLIHKPFLAKDLSSPGRTRTYPRSISLALHLNGNCVASPFWFVKSDQFTLQLQCSNRVPTLATLSPICPRSLTLSRRVDLCRKAVSVVVAAARA